MNCNNITVQNASHTVIFCLFIQILIVRKPEMLLSSGSFNIAADAGDFFQMDGRMFREKEEEVGQS